MPDKKFDIVAETIFESLFKSEFNLIASSDSQPYNGGALSLRFKDV
jgi:hypothetical protein